MHIQPPARPLNVICDVIERRAVVFKRLTCSTFDDVTDYVILCNVGGLLGDVIPLHLTDRLYIIIEYIIKFSKVSEGGSEGGLEGGREPERSRVTG